MGMLNSIAHDFVTCDLGIKADIYIWGIRANIDTLTVIKTN